MPIDQVTEDEAQSRMNEIVRYCVWDVGIKLREGDEEDRNKFREMAVRLYGDYIHEDEQTDANWDEEVMWVGADILKVQVANGRSPEGCMSTHEEWTQRPFGRQLARIRADIVWDAHGGKIPWREFAVLASVYAAIGHDFCACITVDRINSMSLGFNTSSECKASKHSQHKLTDRQIRRTLDTLAARSLFVRLSPNRRHVYYSNRCSETELMEELVAREVKKSQKARTRKTEELRRRVLEQLAQLALKPEALRPPRERLPRTGPDAPSSAYTGA